MSRSIISQKQISALSTQQPDSYSDKLLKLIPTDIISIYLGLTAIVKTQQGNTNDIQWGILVIIFLLTPWYLKKGVDIKTNTQIAVCTLSFLLWALSLGGLLEGIILFNKYSLQFIVSLAVPVYTFVIARLYPS